MSLLANAYKSPFGRFKQHKAFVQTTMSQISGEMELAASRLTWEEGVKELYKKCGLPEPETDDMVFEDRIVEFWQPPGVIECLGQGSRSFVGLLEDGNVLKYRMEQSQPITELELERTIYEALGSHPYILPYLGWDGQGLRFPRRRPILDLTQDATQAQRLTWISQCAIAVAHVHDRGVLHCDIHPRNILLDDQNNIQLCDFQGTYREMSGNALEEIEYSLPEPPGPDFRPSPKRDIFALGSLMFWLMTGAHPYQNVSPNDIEKRFEQQLWPPTDFELGDLVVKCWAQEYRDAGQLVSDLEGAKSKMG